MMYPFMTLDDNTEVVHSEMLPDHRVKVYFEKPDAKDCFHSAVCYLPDYKWEDINGFTPAEIARYQELVESTAHLILQFSKEGGVENAAGISGPMRTSRWNRYTSMWRRVHPAPTPPRYGSPGQDSAI